MTATPPNGAKGFLSVTKIDRPGEDHFLCFALSSPLRWVRAARVSSNCKSGSKVRCSPYAKDRKATADAGRIAFCRRAFGQSVKVAEFVRFRTAHTARSFPPLPNLPRGPPIPACIWGSAFVLNSARNRIRVPHRHKSCGGRSHAVPAQWNCMQGTVQ